MSKWYVVTYDLNNHHWAVKQHCLKNGFTDRLATTGGTKKLPNTTLAGVFNSAEEAAHSFANLAKEVARDVTIERVLACPLAPGFLESEAA